MQFGDKQNGPETPADLRHGDRPRHGVRLFDAACRVADVEPDILVESRAPHTLLALAEAGQGVAIIPSVLRTDRYRVTIARVAHRENRCATVMSFSGTSGGRCRAMRRTSARRSPLICARSCRLPDRPNLQLERLRTIREGAGAVVSSVECAGV
jgi:DNA-binding transcriptional LysR family regulator